MTLRDKDVSGLMTGLTRSLEACQSIEAAGGCEHCPLVECFCGDITALTMNGTAENWNEFFDFARDVEEILEEKEREQDEFYQEQQYENELFWQKYTDSIDKEEIYVTEH